MNAAYASGAAGYLSKTLPARELVEALKRIHEGESVTSPTPSKNRVSVGLDWPGRTEGLSEREAEILALITQGKSNSDIAALVDQLGQVLHAHRVPQAEPPTESTPSCGASSTASNTTTTESTTGSQTTEPPLPWPAQVRCG